MKTQHDWNNPSPRFFVGIWLTVVLVFLLIVLWRGINIIDNGEYAVVAQFGKVEEQILNPGLNFVWPWKTVYRIPSVVQKDEEEAATPTKEGLTCHIKSVLLWRVDPNKLVDIVKQYGTEFEDRIVHPFFRAVIRDVTVQFDSESLYTQDRAKVEALMITNLSKILAQHGILLETVQLSNLTLPDSVRQRIEAKVAAEQDVKRMEYVLQQKTIEGKAKVVEAEAIAKATIIIQKDMNASYLYYLWIQALKEHQGSIIYVPTGADGMPLFKSLDKNREGK